LEFEGEVHSRAFPALLWLESMKSGLLSVFITRSIINVGAFGAVGRLMVGIGILTYPAVMLIMFFRAEMDLAHVKALTKYSK
jgi:hypothetical protein